jgi:hypothetical protein
MTKFIAFAVDAFGAPLARYDLAASEAEAAEQEARQYLERHRVIEVWSAGRTDRRGPVVHRSASRNRTKYAAGLECPREPKTDLMPWDATTSFSSSRPRS